MGYVLLLLIATVPCVLVLHLMGGVSWDVVLLAYLIIFAAVVMCATGCLAVSMRAKSTASAVVGGLLWVLRWTFGWHFIAGLVLWILIWVLGEFGRSGPDPWFVTAYTSIWACSPFGALALGTTPQFQGGLPFTLPPPYFFLIFAGGMILLQFCILLRRIRSPDLSVHPSRASRRSKRRRRPMLVGFFRRFDDRKVWGLSNPVFLKEMSTKFFGRIWFRRVVFWGGLALFCLFSTAGGWRASVAVYVTGYGTMVLCFLMAPAVAGQLVHARE